MRTSDLHHLYQKHYARHCDSLFTYLNAKFVRTLKPAKALLISIPTGLILIAGSIIGMHYLGYLVSVPLIIFFLTLIATAIGAGTYDYLYGSPIDTRRADRLTDILKQQGPQHRIMLLGQYQTIHHDYMDSQELDLLLEDFNLRHKFAVTGNIISLPGQDLTNIVPTPANDDYVTGYHILYRRIQAIRQHPELLHVQDSLIDEVYGIN